MLWSQLGSPTNGLLVTEGLLTYLVQSPPGGSEALGPRPKTTGSCS